MADRRIRTGQHKDVQPAIIVEVEEGYSATHGLDDVVTRSGCPAMTVCFSPACALTSVKRA